MDSGQTLMKGFSVNISTTTLSFHGAEVQGIVRNGDVWLGATQIGLALEYANPETAVTKIFNRHADEFAASMTKMVELVTAGGRQVVRMFSLRGAHLLAMFARTPVAKEFRRWVLDILDREVGRVPVAAATVTVSRGNLEALCQHVEYMRSWWQEFSPAIRALGPDAAVAVHDHFVDGVCVARGIARSAGISLNEKIKSYPWREDSHTRRMYAARNLHT